MCYYKMRFGKNERGDILKTFFGGMFIENDKLENEGIEYPIKLEYFKTLKDKESVGNKYGIQVVKIEYLDKDISIESKEIENITNKEEKINDILNLLKRNEVTPVGVSDVLEDLNIKYF